MNKKEFLFKTFTLLAIFYVGFLIGSLLKLTRESSTFKPYVWESNYSSPIIINCYEGKIDENKVEKAITFWKSTGHRIKFYEHNPPSQSCELEWIDGVIILRKAPRGELDLSTLAITKRKTTLTKIYAVQILLQPGTQDFDLLLEHELGHALGYGHYDVKGHVMHSLYEQMGPMFW